MTHDRSNTPIAETLEAQAHQLELMAAQLRREAAWLRDATQADTESNLLSLEQAALEAGLSMFAIRKLLAEGRLSDVRIGRRRFIPRDSLRDLAEAS